VEQQAARRTIFESRHAAWLRGKCAPRPENLLPGRDAARSGLRLLFIDDRVPHESLGSGFPRSREMLLALVALGHRVSFYPLSFPSEGWHTVYSDIPREVEVLLGRGRAGVEAFLAERRGLYDAILISRPHNMQLLRPSLLKDGRWRDPTPILYDAEALSSLREAGQRGLNGGEPSARELKALVAEEARLAEGVRAVVSVSESEAGLFRGAGMDPVFVLGHAVAAEPTPAPFASRAGLLFVGAIHEEASPNGDSMLWFLSEVMPLLREGLAASVPLRIVGINHSPRIARAAGPDVEVVGPVDDVAPFYDAARLFVAPTRFGAGIPLKAYHAAAHGLPIVATPLVAAHLGWQPGRELLVGEGAQGFAQRCLELYRDPALWEALRERALRRVREECSRTAFRERLAAILRDALRSQAVAAATAGSQRLGG